MKTYFFILYIFSFSVYSQETKTSELDTIRQQGYLMIGTDPQGKLSDITPKFLFVPLKDMEKNIDLSYVKNSQPNYNELYIPTPYLYNEDDLFGLNIYINKFINTKSKIKLNQQTVSTTDFLNKCDNLYKFNDGLNRDIKNFKIVYLDGIWVKLKVPIKRALPISAAYNETRLNKKNNYLEYYFLIETKVISYDVSFTDNSIEIIKDKSKG